MRCPLLAGSIAKGPATDSLATVAIHAFTLCFEVFHSSMDLLKHIENWRSPGAGGTNSQQFYVLILKLGSVHKTASIIKPLYLYKYISLMPIFRPHLHEPGSRWMWSLIVTAGLGTTQMNYTGGQRQRLQHIAGWWDILTKNITEHTTFFPEKQLIANDFYFANRILNIMDPRFIKYHHQMVYTTISTTIIIINNNFQFFSSLQISSSQSRSPSTHFNSSPFLEIKENLAWKGKMSTNTMGNSERISGKWGSLLSKWRNLHEYRGSLKNARNFRTLLSSI